MKPTAEHEATEGRNSSAVTTDKVTDEQILEWYDNHAHNMGTISFFVKGTQLLVSAHLLVHMALYAPDSSPVRRAARIRCAEILNARNK